MKTNLIGVVKEKRTSLFYGVRRDIRVKNLKETIYYRSDIEAENKKYYLGAYQNEQYAAYAYNVAFKFLNNGKYIIENFVEITDIEKQIIEDKVKSLMIKKGLNIILTKIK